MKSAGIFNWERGHALAIPEHLPLQAHQFDNLGRRERRAVKLSVDKVAPTVVLGVGPLFCGSVRRLRRRQHASDRLPVQFYHGTLRVLDQIHLSEFRATDKDALAEHLNDKDIYDRTLRIPFPYTDADADEWLALAARVTTQQGRPVHFAIRSSDETPIGACGFDGFQIGKSHRAEIGYWLAKPLWGRGFMTAVVGRACQHAFEEFGLTKITAHVFSHNPASARVLEKCGFRQEGFLQRHFHKDGQFIDARLFALLK